MRDNARYLPPPMPLQVFIHSGHSREGLRLLRVLRYTERSGSLLYAHADEIHVLRKLHIEAATNATVAFLIPQLGTGQTCTALSVASGF